MHLSTTYINVSVVKLLPRFADSPFAFVVNLCVVQIFSFFGKKKGLKLGLNSGFSLRGNRLDRLLLLGDCG